MTQNKCALVLLLLALFSVPAAAQDGEIMLEALRMYTPVTSTALHTSRESVAGGSNVLPSTWVFTDPALIAGKTPIRAVHFTELREAVNAFRLQCGLARTAWTDPLLTPGVTPVRTVHLVEIRTGLTAAYRACGLAAPRFTGAVHAGMSIKALHVIELRDAVNRTSQNGAVDVARFLEENPRIAAAMTWLGTDNRLRPYAEWPAALKGKLALFTDRLVATGTRLPEVPINQADRSWWTVLSKGDAEDLYVANVAYSLVIEMLGAVPWSLGDLSGRELALLLGSENFYYDYGSFGVEGYTVEGPVIPAPPEVIRDFLAAGGLVGNSRHETLVNVIDWARYHLYHYSVPIDRDNYEADVDHWDYRGGSPLARVLGGTTRKRDGKEGHPTAGCHGTNWFLIHALRAVNIPVEYVIWAGHAIPSFPSEALYLSHGDDPYTQGTMPIPPFPEPFSASEIPIDEATYKEWFSESNSDEENLNNVGRRTTELAVKYLSPSLLRLRCDDLAHGRSNEESEVYRPGSAGVGRYWTVAELEAMRFWERMDAKIAQYGGCSVFGY